MAKVVTCTVCNGQKGWTERIIPSDGTGWNCKVRIVWVDCSNCSGTGSVEVESK
jgi:hypothetical protein